MAIDHAQKALVYHYNGSMFEIFQSIKLTTNTSLYSNAGALTDDHKLLVAGINNTVRVYTFVEHINSFILHYSIVGYEGAVTHISLTNDHSYMAVTLDNDVVAIHKNNGTHLI